MPLFILTNKLTDISLPSDENVSKLFKHLKLTGCKYGWVNTWNKHSHSDSCDQQTRSHITQYHCGCCKLEYLSGNSETTLTEATMHKLDVQYPKRYTAKLLFHQSQCCTVTTLWLDSDSVVTVVDCRQHGDYTAICRSVLCRQLSTVTTQ